MVPGLECGSGERVSSGDKGSDFFGHRTDCTLDFKDVIVVFAVKDDVIVNEDMEMVGRAGDGGGLLNQLGEREQVAAKARDKE
jgi:hypothetical protein